MQVFCWNGLYFHDKISSRASPRFDLVIAHAHHEYGWRRTESINTTAAVQSQHTPEYKRATFAPYRYLPAGFPARKVGTAERLQFEPIRARLASFCAQGMEISERGNRLYLACGDTSIASRHVSALTGKSFGERLPLPVIGRFATVFDLGASWAINGLIGFFDRRQEG